LPDEPAIERVGWECEPGAHLYVSTGPKASLREAPLGPFRSPASEPAVNEGEGRSFS